MLNLNFSCGFSFFVLSLLLVVVDYLLIVWFLRFVLISVFPSFNDDLAF